jgi:hypothetical protein
MHKKHPDTFEAPTKEELDALKVGNIVKVSHNNERFWVTITAIDKDIITGKVDNVLIRPQPFKYGDIIKFKKHHIYMT